MVVNNVLSWQSIPPGTVEDTPDGPRQRYFHDFFNYAGLHRSVWLSATPRRYIEDITVVTGLDGSTGNRRLRGRGAPGSEVRVALRDAAGAEVARATGATGELTVADVHPWRPGEGYLYDLDVELWDERAGGRLLAPRRRAHGAGGRHALPHQRRAVPLQGLRAGTRTPPSAARAMTTRSWSTTSR